MNRQQIYYQSLIAQIIVNLLSHYHINNNQMDDEVDKQKKIGNYILGKTIGEGTFGKVKLASHTLTKEKVAIKILVKQKIIDVADVERVSREIHILKLIRHPSIIQLYEIIETARHLFLVMEYVEQGELFDFIVKKNKLDQKQACQFFKHIISGVAYLHQLKIVHRDLKPQNLLIDWKDSLKIVDFGLSNTYKTGQLLKTACGSPCYAAPQMISSKKYNGLEVDIWSCGVILFAMVCGYLPFEDTNTSQLYKKILSGEYVLPQFVSAEFKDLLQKILCVDPEKRYRLEQIYEHSWCKADKEIPLKSGIIVGYHRIPVDKNILEKLTQFNFDLEYAQRCIEANKHNHITTAYYLLLKKQLKNGYQSTADLSSTKFDYGSVEPFKKINNENRYRFFGGNDESPMINIQTHQINLFKKNQKISPPLKINSTKEKHLVTESNRFNKFFEKEKKQLHQSFGSKKVNDLRMYLKPSNKKKDFYSEVKKRQERRNQALSLYCDLRQNRKEEIGIRMNTEYPEDKKSRQYKKQKYMMNQSQNQVLSKSFKDKNS